ncbi:peptide chain release factor N(5)-glutamine methyltransferase [Anaerococcus marasmi]|uniref:peptide chain release factor N(5)-glutamine methyltransferase n=1 Tax=Anaerococcus marasmi TaxID=2057797 RepID=UPI000CF9FEE2|nr:peptide chain release factor N(5)-glutamine methyltransferase [Anaerococcus marasmi]
MKIKDYLDKNYDISLIALTYLLDTNKSSVILKSEEELDDKISVKLDDIIARYNKGYPLQYAIGEWEFYGLNFKVDERALIPRFETEIIVDFLVKSSYKKDKILDIGTGSGAIAISLGKNLPASEIVGSDIKDKALSLAQENKERLKAFNVSFIKSNLFEEISEKFDIIISNPPYINQTDYDKLDERLYFEPKSALLASEDGLYFYKRIIKDAKAYLNQGGRLVFEIGYDQKQRICELLNESDFKNIKSMKDYNDFDRFIIAEKG